MATRKTLVGIRREITPSGLFPLAPSADAAEADTLWQLSAGNYNNYHDYRDGADEILRKDLDARKLEWAPTVRELETRHGPIKRSKNWRRRPAEAREAEVEVDTRPETLWRECASQTHERVVLPRHPDVVTDAFELMAECHRHYDLGLRACFRQCRTQACC